MTETPEIGRNLIQGGTEVILVPVCTLVRKDAHGSNLSSIIFVIIKLLERERERNMVDSLKHKPQFLQKIKLVNEKDFNPNVVASFNYSNPSTIFAWAQIVEVERETHITFLNLVQNKIY